MNDVKQIIIGCTLGILFAAGCILAGYWAFLDTSKHLQVLCLRSDKIIILSDQKIFDSERFGTAEAVCSAKKRQYEFTLSVPSQCSTLAVVCVNPDQRYKGE